MARYEAKTYEALRKRLPTYIRVASDKKTGIITVEVDDKDPKFAADLANAHAGEITKVLGRLAVSEAQVRRVFFEQQLKDTKENLVKAEQALRGVQEKSGVIVLDKQAEALIAGAALVRSQIAEREVQLKVLRNSATEQNPDVQRLSSELGALRGELARMESSRGGAAGSTVDMPVGKIPAAAIDYVRARRELKLQETLLESMVRQYEIAKLDEAKDAPLLQQVDVALPPDYKSKPSRAMIVLGGTLLALIAAMVVAIWRGYAAASAAAEDPQRRLARAALSQAWRWRK
jgi:capsule polysaccharide export protein KpsE/RkpR